MICEQLQSLAGIECMPLDEAGSVACIFLPLTFSDGDGMHVFVERVGNLIKFTDGGDVYHHFAGLGMDLSDGRKTAFLKNLASAYDVTLSDDMALECIVSQDKSQKGFADMLATFVSIRDWDAKNDDFQDDEQIFAAEVEMLLRSIHIDSEFGPSVTIKGLTKHEYRIDFTIDGQMVVPVKRHSQSINAALKKILDIMALPSAPQKPLIVFDDRSATDSQKEAASLLQTVGELIMFKRLEASQPIRQAH